MLLLTLEAFAAPPTESPEGPHFGLALRGVAETWDDTAIGSTYRTGAFASGAALIMPLMDPVTLSVEATYRRAGASSAGDALFEITPISIVGEWAFYRDDRGEVYGGGGPTITVFSERHPGNGDTAVVRGTRLGLEARIGGRFNTNLVSNPLPPAPQGLDRIELEIYAARRFQRPGLTGFQLGAWRAGLGVVFRL
jgi:hypothetical protein